MSASPLTIPDLMALTTLAADAARKAAKDALRPALEAKGFSGHDLDVLVTGLAQPGLVEAYCLESAATLLAMPPAEAGRDIGERCRILAVGLATEMGNLRGIH